MTHSRPRIEIGALTNDFRILSFGRLETKLQVRSMSRQRPVNADVRLETSSVFTTGPCPRISGGPKFINGQWLGARSDNALTVSRGKAARSERGSLP